MQTIVVVLGLLVLLLILGGGTVGILETGWPRCAKAAAVATLLLVWVGCLALMSSGGQPERSWVDVLLAAGRYLLLFAFLSMIVLGWPLVWLTDWPKWTKVLACAVLAVVAIGGRILLGWYDQPSSSIQVPEVHNERLDRHVDLPPPRR